MSDTIRLIAEFFAACVGTIAFALLFQVPRKYYLYCGLAGACGWICYKLILPHTTEPVSIFFATVLVILLSRSFARRCKRISDTEGCSCDCAWHSLCF